MMWLMKDLCLQCCETATSIPQLPDVLYSTREYSCSQALSLTRSTNMWPSKQKAIKQEPETDAGIQSWLSLDALEPSNDVQPMYAGVIEYDDGSTYDGQVLGGKRHGHGVLKTLDNKYDGQWLADEKHGKGVQLWSDGRRYEGDFSHGTFTGFGVMQWRSSTAITKFMGFYKDGLKHGPGKFIRSDGKTYEGQWFAGMRHGKRSVDSPCGESTDGFWNQDKVLVSSWA